MSQTNEERSNTNSSPISHSTDLISKLPTRETPSPSEPLLLYKNFWFRQSFLKRIMLLEASFKARHDDIILATNPKCGTTCSLFGWLISHQPAVLFSHNKSAPATSHQPVNSTFLSQQISISHQPPANRTGCWLKALAFAITNRSRYDFGNHPLLTRHPQEVIPTIDVEIPLNGNLTCIEKLPSPRILATHMPLLLLPESVSIQGCRIVYICRDPKDAFVSRLHFVSDFYGEKTDMNVSFNMFCEGISGYGPYWDHCLEYWKESITKPDRVLFLKYEEMILEPVKFVKVLASFLRAPFTSEEEDNGVPEEVVKLCSFKTLSCVNSTQTEVVEMGSVVVKRSAYFRKGKVGDWVNHISEEMARKLDDIVEEKLKGSGLVF